MRAQTPLLSFGQQVAGGRATRGIPVEARDATEAIDVGKEAGDGVVMRDRQGAKSRVAADVVGEELAADGLGGQHVVVAVVAAPFGKVVGDIEGGGGRGRVLVVDERDRLVELARFSGGDDDVSAEQVVVGKDELHGLASWANKHGGKEGRDKDIPPRCRARTRRRARHG